MQPYSNQNDAFTERDLNEHHSKCRKHLYQFIQVELNDGSVYQGILHSFDREKMYLIMPRAGHSQTPHTMDESNESRLFPFLGPFGLFGFPFFGIRRFGPFFPFFI
ncbi:hypothetical protein [Ornithinibacillus bavariensis]|uniref:hypothetical protein n=1 Tax=Ornithinibacillus bavariensis TaxID=545502 RepID=UPI000EDA2D72|nr:hypothetical protein [Ornithinibacillus sp.]